MKAVVSACVVAAAAYALYASTLLPGQDLGDTAVFQVIAASGAKPTARDAYPLYYVLATQAARLEPSNPARAINRVSAAAAACAAGVFVWLALELTSNVAAAVVSALLFATSYTWWTQSVIAEVYSLHVLFVFAEMGALLAWARRASLMRLGAFFAIYAFSFGNHLSSVLLFPAFTVAIIVEARQHPGGIRSVLRPPVILLALACAAAGALQYAPMLRGMTLSAFWNDVTKADWRETLIMGVRLDQVRDRIAMYGFELRQQFGWPAVLIAAVGAFSIVRHQPRAGLMLWLAFAATFLFAFTYNVGDSHVFFLTSHAILALWVACGVAGATARLKPGTTTAITALLSVYVVFRLIDTYPAVDRSRDRRPEAFFAAMTTGLTPMHDVFVPDLNWQQIDGLAYYSTITRPDVVWTPLDRALPRLDALARDNVDIGRVLVTNARGRRAIESRDGAQFDVEPDRRVNDTPLRDVAEAAKPGTPYAITWITPYADSPVESREFIDAARRLSAAQSRAPDTRLAAARYVVVVGKVGESPRLIQRGDRPFRATVNIDGVTILARFDAWPAFDTIRRAGFGHVIAGGRDVLPIDRGISLVLLDDPAGGGVVVYRGGILEPQQRFIIHPRATLK